MNEGGAAITLTYVAADRVIPGGRALRMLWCAMRAARCVLGWALLAASSAVGGCWQLVLRGAALGCTPKRLCGSPDAQRCRAACGRRCDLSPHVGAALR